MRFTNCVRVNGLHEKASLVLSNRSVTYVRTRACHDSPDRANQSHALRSIVFLFSSQIPSMSSIVEPDNVQDHQAGMSDSPLQSTRKSGFVCIRLLLGFWHRLILYLIKRRLAPLVSLVRLFCCVKPILSEYVRACLVNSLKRQIATKARSQTIEE